MSRLDKRRDLPETIAFAFNGRSIEAIPGESIAAALSAAGERVLRSDSRNKSRGMLCGMGACFECRVVANGVTQRACLTAVTDGMQVTSLPFNEPLPRFVTPKVSAAASEAYHCDVAIVGAGPAGMSAAIELAEAGRKVVVLDERPASGGQFYKQKFDAIASFGQDDRQYIDGAVLIQRLRRCGAKLLQSATVWGGFRRKSGVLELAGLLSTTNGSKSILVIADTVVVAVGAYESVPVFPGWTLPGVMTTGAAQGLMRSYRVSPGQRVLIAGNGPLNLQLACELLEEGVNVVAVAEAAPANRPSRVVSALGASIASAALVARGIRYLAMLRKNNVPVMSSHHVLNADGIDGVRTATIAKLDSKGHFIGGSEKVFDVDALCVGYTLRPSIELIAALGCRLYERPGDTWVPERDGSNRTSVAGVFAIGDGAAIGGAQIAMLEGRMTAREILGRPVNWRDFISLRRHRRFQHHLWDLYRAPAVKPSESDEVICRCESVTRSTLTGLADSAVWNINRVKHSSRVGMGICQGRYCQKNVREICLSNDRKSDAYSQSKAPIECQTFTARLPVKPVRIATIAAEKPEWQGYREAENPLATLCLSSANAKSFADTDVLIIGAGIIGAATAMYAAREAIDVMVIDRRTVNDGASGANAGSLHHQLLPFDFSVKCQINSPTVQTLYLQGLGIERWQSLNRELDGGFELSISGGLILADSADAFVMLQKKAALEVQAGVDVDILSAAETRSLIPEVGEDIIGAAYCSSEGKLNPLLATTVLIDAAKSNGALVEEHVEVLGIEFRERRFLVTTNRGMISARRVVNAAGAWAGQISNMLQIPIPVKPAPQQMMVTQAIAPVIPYLLALMGRHLSLKQTTNGNVLIGGGWPGEIDPRTRRCIVLRESIEGNLWAALQALPRLGGLDLIRSWSAMGVMIDGAPIVGSTPRHPNFYTAVGANGYTMGPAIGQILSELLAGRDSPIDLSPFSIERFN